MDLGGKKIAVLGGTRISCEIVKAAQALGMHVTVIDYNQPEDSPGKRIADDHALISVADVEAVAEYIKSNKIDGVLTGYSDALLGWYADICERAEVPCYGTREQFEIFSNKHLWKELCREFGVPTALEFEGEEVFRLPEDKIDFPLFVKPSDGCGARGATVARTKEELLASWHFAQQFAGDGKVIVEKYLEGPEVTVFWVFIDGEYSVYQMGNRLVKHNQRGVIPLPAGYTFPSSALPLYLEGVAPSVRSLFDSVGIKDGMMFMQCILQEDVPYVYDIGYRLTGSLEHYLVKEQAGYSPMDMLLHFAVTGRMTDDPCINDKISKGLYAPCFNLSCLMSPGTIDHFEGLDAVDADPSVIAYAKAHVEGETLPPEARGQLRQIALRVLGKVDDADDLESVMLRLQGEIAIVSPEGEDLMLDGLDSSDFGPTMISSQKTCGRGADR